MAAFPAAYEYPYYRYSQAATVVGNLWAPPSLNIFAHPQPLIGAAEIMVPAI
jgi:hypothetical protein